MKSLEQFRAEQAEAMKKAEAAHIELLARAQCFGDAGLPIPEYIAEGNLYGAVTCTYRNSGGLRKGHMPETLRSMSEAVALFRHFAEAGRVIAFHAMRDSCLILHPEKYMPAKHSNAKRDSYKNGAYAAFVRVSHLSESNITSAEIEFFAHLGNKLFRVSIEFGQGYIGKCPKLAPKIEIRRNWQREIVEVKVNPNADAFALADSFVSWATGDKKNADHSYLFVSDHDNEDGDPVECTHAIGQLENLAAIIDGVTK